MTPYLRLVTLFAIALALCACAPSSLGVAPGAAQPLPTRTPLPGPTVTFMGPIVGPGYTLPPTPTPRVTVTAATPATPTPGAPVQATSARPTGTAIPSYDMSRVGVQSISFLEQEDWFEVLRRTDQLGVGWIKLQLDWSFAQPGGPEDVGENFRRFQIYVQQASNQGYRVLLSIAKAPDWARSTSDEDGPPDDPQALARFVSLVLQEYGSAVSAIEVWNEPNLIREWRGRPMTGAEYMRYFVPTYQAIRAYSPSIAVVTAGLAPTVDTDGSRNDRTFLREMYAAGLAQYGDVALGVHPYSWANGPDARCCDPVPDRGWDEHPSFFFANTMQDVRSIRDAAGHNAPLWITEVGWATWARLPGEPPDPWMAFNDEWQQADYTLRALSILQAQSDVGPVFLWNLNFSQAALVEARDERSAYALVYPMLNPMERPLYWMLYDAARPDESLPRYD